MAYVNRAGRYLLQVKEANWGSGEGGDYLYMRFVADQIWLGSNWDGEVQGLEVTGYFRPLKKNGERNRGFSMQMMTAFQWDGEDWGALEPAKLIGQYVQAEVTPDSTKPNRFNVDWLDHHSSTGGDRAQKSVTVDVSSVAAKFKAAKESKEMPIPPKQSNTSKPIPPVRK